MRILIAQQQGAEQSIAGLLRRHRYTTECVQTTQDVLDWAQSGEWDCLVLDDRLGGLDPVRRLRANRCSLPILLLTGSTDARSRVRALDAGADDCFSRPFYPDELVARVRAEVERHPAIHIEDTSQFYDMEVFNRCAQTHHVLLTLECWSEVHPGLVTLPVDDAEKLQYFLLEEFQDQGETVMYAPGEGFYGEPGKGRNEIRIAYVTNPDDLIRSIELLGLGIRAYNSRKQ